MTLTAVDALAVRRAQRLLAEPPNPSSIDHIAVLTAALDKLNAELAEIDAELLRLAGRTPEERRGWIRRMNRPKEG
ncbi:MAG: hypothetical protein ACRDT6_01620 [Micromonosporaceae bacterium]